MDTLLGILMVPVILLLLVLYGTILPVQFLWGFVGATWIIVFLYAFFGGEDVVAPLNHILPESWMEDGKVPGWFSTLAFIGFWGGLIACAGALFLSILDWRPTSIDPGKQAYYDQMQHGYDAEVRYLQQSAGISTDNPWAPGPWVSASKVWFVGVLTHFVWAIVFHAYRSFRDGYNKHVFFEENDELSAIWYNDQGDEGHMFPQHKRSAWWSMCFEIADWFDNTRLGAWILRKRGINP